MSNIKINRKSVKVIFFYNLYILPVIALFVYLYVWFAPYTNGSSSFGFFLIFLVLSFILSVVVSEAGEEYKFYDFLRYLELSEDVRYKNGNFFLSFFVFAWVFALFYAPANLARQEEKKAEQFKQESLKKFEVFKTKAFDIFNKGDCETVREFDENGFNVCKQMKKARSITRGQFLIVTKELASNGVACQYRLMSLGADKYSFNTDAPEGCDLKIGQEVSLVVVPEITVNISTIAFGYSVRIEKVK